MTEITMTKVPTEYHRKIKALKKSNKQFKDTTIFGIYRVILEAGFDALKLEAKK